MLAAVASWETIRPATPPGAPVSKSSVRINLLQALCAIILGNVAYFVVAPSLPLLRHQPFHLDAGLVVDFFFCVVAYGLIRTARRWK
jgi:hypothetical protein